MDERRSDFINSIADFLKIDLKNSVTKEFIAIETAFVRDEWFVEFINFLGNTKTEYKRPLDILTCAINNYKEHKFRDYYAQIDDKIKYLINKLQDTFKIFDQAPEKEIKYEFFRTYEGDTVFEDKEISFLNKVGTWRQLYAKRNDIYSLTVLMQSEYKKHIDNKIKSSAKMNVLGYTTKSPAGLIGNEPSVQKKEKIDARVIAMMSGAIKNE